MAGDASEYPVGVWMNLCAASLFSNATLSIHAHAHFGMIAGALAAILYRLARGGTPRARLTAAREALVELPAMFLGMSLAANFAMTREPGLSTPALQYLAMGAVMAIGMVLGGALAASISHVGARGRTLLLPPSAGERR